MIIQDNTLEQELEKDLGFDIDADGTIRASFDKHQNIITPHEAVLKLKAYCLTARQELTDERIHATGREKALATLERENAELKRINERAYGMSRTELALQGDRLAGKNAELKAEVDRMKVSLGEQAEDFQKAKVAICAERDELRKECNALEHNWRKLSESTIITDCENAKLRKVIEEIRDILIAAKTNITLSPPDAQTVESNLDKMGELCNIVLKSQEATQ